MTAFNAGTFVLNQGVTNLTRLCLDCAAAKRSDDLAFVWFFIMGFGFYHLRGLVLNSSMKPEAKTRYARALYVTFNLMFIGGIVWYLLVSA